MKKLIADNESFHKLLVDGVSIPISKGGEERHIIVNLFDYNNLENNGSMTIGETVSHFFGISDKTAS
ncbi:hypothetical protein HYW21_03280 [Candidatus Woesearchaeota archaeon]|nr:hypothetical protein [Candidatus Woesearchaeota archaeon]